MNEETKATRAPSADAVACRNPYWDEMTDEQRLVALRDAVVWMARDLKTANDNLAKLGHHQHAADGSLLAPIYTGLGPMNEGGYSPGYANNLRSKRDSGR